MKQPTKQGAKSLPVYPDERPKNRGECYDMPRPCPFVSCKWHLAHDRMQKAVAGQRPKGHPPQPRMISRDFTDEEIVEWIASAEHTCALDVADTGPHDVKMVAPLVRTARSTASTMGRRPTETHPALREWLRSIGKARSESYDPTLFAEKDDPNPDAD